MTEEEILTAAKLAWGRSYQWFDDRQEFASLRRFARAIAAAEREACAKIVEDSPSYDWHKFACEAAWAIRARGEKQT